jgi:hypothetical protein
MSVLARIAARALFAAGKAAFNALAASLKDFMINPIPVKVKDYQIILLISRPTKYEGKNQIGLVLVGNLDEQLIPEIEEDLTAGIAAGHFWGVERSKELKFKADNLKILSNAYENYQFKYEEIGQLGATIGKGIYESKDIRKDLKKVIKVKGINWYEDSDNMLARVKLKNYHGNAVITYWEKMMTQNEWAIPFEATRIWHHIRLYPGDEAQKIVDNLAAAFASQDEKAAQQAIKDVGNFISEEDKRRKQAAKAAKKAK